MEEEAVFDLPWPNFPADADVFFHKDVVCYYHAGINTWECRRITPHDALEATRVRGY